MSSYPPYKRNAFQHVAKSLSIVDYFLVCEACEKEYRAAAAAFEDADHKYQRSAGAACATFKEYLKTSSSAADGNTTLPTDIFKDALRKVEYARTVGDRDAAIVSKNMREAAVACLPIFFKFDEKKFEQFRALVDKDNNVSEDRTEKLKIRNQAAGKFKSAMLDYKNCFTDFGFMEGCEKGREYRRAYEEASRFCNTWKQRVRQFEVPVTIECTAINTLPEETKQLWMSSYKKLGLDKLIRKPQYIPFVYKEYN